VRGGCGVLIGVVLMAITREKLVGGFTPMTVSRNGERGRSLREVGDDMRVPPVGEEKRKLGTVLGAGRCWAVGSIWSWAERFPPGPFLFLFLLSSFSISVFFISSYPFQI
jgi:hypothetical protein